MPDRRRKEPDLGRLGKRSWIKEQLDGPAERDDSIVTGYSGVPSTDIDALRTLTTARPDDVAMKDMLAFMLYSNGRLDEALELFKDLVERNHNPGNQHLYLGNIYFKKGLLSMALVHWDKVRECAPVSPEAAKARERSAHIRQGLSPNLDDGRR